MGPKAVQYMHQLDHARCDGNWDVVPELVRKVRKHAPDRACMTPSHFTALQRGAFRTQYLITLDQVLL
ncbi:hypothetical protein FSOLCH5_003177 [Fusarium solani]